MRLPAMARRARPAASPGANTENFETGFEGLRENYRNLLALAMIRRRLFVTGFLALVLVSFVLRRSWAPTSSLRWIRADRAACAPAIGTRIEDDTQIFAASRTRSAASSRRRS